MKIQIFLFGAIGAIMALWLGWGFFVIYSTARPPYQVIRNLSAAIEVRQYEDQTWISTPMMTDDSSFPVLASYIFGRNKEEQQVAMTAPVITDHRMAFILPRGLTAATAPVPDGQAIDFTTVPARKLATLEFSWWTPVDRVAAKTAELLDTLDAHGIATRGGPFLMRYNDPWTPPFLRRNEVAIEAL
ncbi:MAG: heme-binding protein [Candidatus Latescibacteria bacterium]|nr:heme-binding protein [Candidatus Latescibacterota bacterium]